MAAQVARALGHLTIVGLGGGAIEVVSLAQAGKIKMLVEHFPLERAAEAYHLLHDGKIKGRAVITPND
jgi:propanol-preferring alcohol dehydrogenase